MRTHSLFAFNSVLTRGPITDSERAINIQPHAILPIIQGRNVIAQTQSSINKTAIFSITMLQSIDITVRKTQALVLSPTRQHARHIRSVLRALGRHTSIRCHACHGGSQRTIDQDVYKLKDGQHIVLGTPWDVLCMIQQYHLRTDKIKILILDYVDALLDNGLKDQIYAIHTRLPSPTQVVLFSATLPDGLHEIKTKFMADPICILVKCEESKLEDDSTLEDESILEWSKQTLINVKQEMNKFDTPAWYLSHPHNSLQAGHHLL